MGKPIWQQNVGSMLAEGWGVEDIALKLSVDVESVRMMVRTMRQFGALDRIFGGRT